MPASPLRVYWDSCVFIDYVERTSGVIATLDSIVLAARRNELAIMTSVLTISEVSHAAAERASGYVDPASFAAVDAMWIDRSIVTLIEVDAVIAMTAREIVRRGMNDHRAIKPPDAIHLATARQYSCSDFHTTDEKLQRWDGEWFPVRAPFVSTPMLPLDP